ncbi:GNAT family N-acetyltransferase [Symbiobacterium terraclitae]|uniref:GNAT family N-acetyltransferase n=1 Tax=Symbiobacterium terraclitae TaxID=557451 RepID=UPI0035B53D51
MDVALLADLWEENQEHLKQHLGESTQEAFGARWVLMPSAPYPRYNHVGYIRVGCDEAEELIAAARVYFREQGLPQVAFLTTPATQPADLAQRLLRQGYRSEAVPVMVWDGTPLPLPRRPDLRVVRLRQGDFELFWQVMRQVFFPGATGDYLAAGRKGVEVADALGAFHYVAFLGGRPVGGGTLYRRGRMGGIYNLCTLPAYQRLGVATEVLRTAIADALENGCDYVGLTPTAMGRRLYQRLGFRDVYHEIYLSQRFQRPEERWRVH